MLLNRTYYHKLWQKYQDLQILPHNFTDKVSVLTLKLILVYCRQRKSLHINFQSPLFPIQDIAKQLFVELSNEVFCNAADFPPLNIGDKVRSKKQIAVGKPKPRFLNFQIVSIEKRNYVLNNEEYALTWPMEYSKLVEDFIPVTQKVQNKTLTGFISYFEKLNGKVMYDFTPTCFERKNIFVAPTFFFNTLEVRNKIPTTYYPNPQQENLKKEKKTIQALSDSIMYFVPKYDIAYQNGLFQRKNISTVVLFDTEENNVEQIIQDKNRLGFNVIQLTKSTNPIKSEQIPLWDWFNEEIEIINAL